MVLIYWKGLDKGKWIALQPNDPLNILNTTVPSPDVIFFQQV